MKLKEILNAVFEWTILIALFIVVVFGIILNLI